MGKPTSITPQDRLVAELAAGHSLRVAAAALGISERTAQRWLSAHREEVLKEVVSRAVSEAVRGLTFRPGPRFVAALAGPSRLK